MTHFVDLIRQVGENAGQRALWGSERKDLDCTLVAWNMGEGVAKHTYDEVDVIMIVIEGRALVELSYKDQQLTQGQLIIIRKESFKRIKALSDRLVYLNVHQRRKPMSLTKNEHLPGRD